MGQADRVRHITNIPFLLDTLESQLAVTGQLTHCVIQIYLYFELPNNRLLGQLRSTLNVESYRCTGHWLSA